jgi:hypothetical protein
MLIVISLINSEFVSTSACVFGIHFDFGERKESMGPFLTACFLAGEDLVPGDAASRFNVCFFILVECCTAALLAIALVGVSGT